MNSADDPMALHKARLEYNLRPVPEREPIFAVCQELEQKEHKLSEAIEEQEVGLMSISCIIRCIQTDWELSSLELCLPMSACRHAGCACKRPPFSQST